MAPLAEMVLRENGIEHRFKEKLSFYTRSLSDVRVLVARRDFDRADAALLSLQEH